MFDCSLSFLHGKPRNCPPNFSLEFIPIIIDTMPIVQIQVLHLPCCIHCGPSLAWNDFAENRNRSYGACRPTHASSLVYINIPQKQDIYWPLDGIWGYYTEIQHHDHVLVSRSTKLSKMDAGLFHTGYEFICKYYVYLGNSVIGGLSFKLLNRNCIRKIFSNVGWNAIKYPGTTHDKI